MGEGNEGRSTLNPSDNNDNNCSARLLVLSPSRRQTANDAHHRREDRGLCGRMRRARAALGSRIYYRTESIKAVHIHYSYWASQHLRIGDRACDSCLGQGTVSNEEHHTLGCVHWRECRIASCAQMPTFHVPIGNPRLVVAKLVKVNQIDRKVLAGIAGTITTMSTVAALCTSRVISSSGNSSIPVNQSGSHTPSFSWFRFSVISWAVAGAQTRHDSTGENDSCRRKSVPWYIQLWRYRLMALCACLQFAKTHTNSLLPWSHTCKPPWTMG